jgi:hypothetical protein
MDVKLGDRVLVSGEWATVIYVDGEFKRYDVIFDDDLAFTVEPHEITAVQEGFNV